VVALLEAGSILLAIGLLLFPFGIVYFKDSWNDIKEFPWWKKILGIILEVVEVFIAPTEGAISVLFLSIIILLVGGLFLLANFHLINVQKL
jgi:hypothetical protein